MAPMNLLHRHPVHRTRQLRWVVPVVVLLLVAVLATLAVQYRVADQDVGAEFFHAHKTIAHTGELLRRGLMIGAGVLTLLALAVGAWMLRLTHRIVAPVHTLHRALEALAAGDLGVRVELHRHDEFQEVGAALNRLVDEFAGTLGRVHALVDRLDGMAGAGDGGALHDLTRELDRTMAFFRLEPRRTIAEDRS